ncbi:3-dehydroquinate synthase [Schlesneria paludicola]|uniref:3-dehydroquinate synthase n=1 Tax=Schlesneria paludicola TaxID=360056 RepID=UPI000311F18D|nr:3-dehydroquinate synthase [Schlesneria paludicola]
MNQNNDAIQVDLGPRSYEIPIVSHQLADCAKTFYDWWYVRDGMSSAFCSERPPLGSAWTQEKRRVDPPFALLITDANVAELHGKTVQKALIAAGWRCETEILPAGETSKSLEKISQVYNRLIDLNADRRTVIVAVGGGVVGDAAGFVAATYMRGLPFIQVPTTLLSAVDSSVGGKTGVNHTKAKNMIGAFYQPIGVFIDTTTMESLPDREYRAGLAEVVKYGVILDAGFFAYLEQNVEAINARQPDAVRHMIARSCRLKADVVEQDEHEKTGLRASLNYGHTFGHAFEALAGYGELLHGEAVAIGMIYASRLAERRGLIDASVTQRQIALLKALHLPTQLPCAIHFGTEEILGRMRLDKKSVSGRLRFILPSEIGKVQVYADIPESDVKLVLES